MKVAAAAVVGLVALAACSGSAATGGATSPSSSASPSARVTPTPSVAGSTTPSPADVQLGTLLECAHPVTATRGLALFLYTGTDALGIVDVSDPLKPSLLCTLIPAQGGRFVQSRDEVVFWTGDQLGSADLSTGKVVRTGRLPQTPLEGAFSPDGATFAYRAGDSAGRIYTDIISAGLGRTLYVEEPIGGHGGPVLGPVDELEFSPDGSELLDFVAFRPPSGPDNFLVYRTANILTKNEPSDSFQILHASQAVSGVWSPTGNTLYYYEPGANPSSGQLLSLDATGQTQTVASGLSYLFWPRMAPQGDSIFYNPLVPTGPDDQCGGVPRLWRVDLVAGHAAQMTAVISSEPVFVSQTVVWTNEQAMGPCGPGGESYPDGAILAYDVAAAGSVTRVDMTSSVPGIGAPQPNTSEVIDVWL